MGVDTRFLFVRKSGVSRAEICDIIDSSVDTIDWLGDESFSLFAAIRYQEWEFSTIERRIRMTLSQVPLQLFPLIEPFALACPDTSMFTNDDTFAAVAESEDCFLIEFLDYTPDDLRLKASATKERKEMMESVASLVHFSKFLQNHPDFLDQLNELALAKQQDAMIALARAEPELADHVDILIRARQFESYIRQTELLMAQSTVNNWVN